MLKYVVKTSARGGIMTFKITKLEKECEEINQNFLKLTACFTGHRNQKLPWGFNEKDIRYILTKIQTKNVIKNAIKML